MIERQRASVSLPGVQAGIDFLGEEEHWRRIRWKLDRMDREAFVGLMAGMGDNDVLAELGRLRCKTTILVGEHDSPFIEPSTKMAEAIPNARLVTIPAAAHCPQYENATAWRAAIDAHLEWAGA
jgi:pimeloyl-ACP methyl ester carboxylesterase